MEWKTPFCAVVVVVMVVVVVPVVVVRVAVMLQFTGTKAFGSCAPLSATAVWQPPSTFGKKIWTT